MIWQFRHRTMNFERVRLVGILNVTPDSFSDGGVFFSPERALERSLGMEKEGADLIDVGGESTRPGAHPVSEEEELGRIVSVISEIRTHSQIPISVDTTKPNVARKALEAGADIINDVDGLNASSEMAEVVREFSAGLVLMHCRGTPQTMQSLTGYEDVTEDVFRELNQSFEEVLQTGVSADQIVLDPGLGFSKTALQNFNHFLSWQRPILVGPSRKSFIGNQVAKEPGERDWGTAAAVALAVAGGAHLIRGHNVSAMKDVICVSESIVHSESEHRVRS